MDTEQKINNDDIMKNRELIIQLKSSTSLYLKNFQQSFVDFCQEMNGLYNEENFFRLSMTDQMRFNDCIEKVSLKVKKDFVDLEKFYSNCKTDCFDKYDKFIIEKTISDYLESNVKYYKKLHPCVDDCIQLYLQLTKRYYTYMIDGNYNIF
jgi:hypothetical protein